VQNLRWFWGFRAGVGGRDAQAQGRRGEGAELIAKKRGLFLAFLGLFLQTKEGFEDQKWGSWGSG